MKLFSLHRVAVLGVAFFVLSGCSTLPRYEFKPGEQSAKVTLVGAGSPWICKDHVLYTPQKIEAGGRGWAASYVFDVPAGERIQLSSYMFFFDNYRTTTTCVASISFVPLPGASYVANGNMKGEGCNLELAREDNTTETGISREPSVGGQYCGK